MSDFSEKAKSGLDWAQRSYFIVQVFLALGLGHLLNDYLVRHSALIATWKVPIWLISSALLLALFTWLWDRFGTPTKTPPTPIARTSVSQKWLYTPLKQVYRTNFHDQEINLDGHIFIDCTFGGNLTLVFNGIAPFKIEPFERTKDFTFKFKTDNLAIQHFLRFQHDAGKIVGEIANVPPAIK
jgi:hypothetical protein